jgi:hypothetical protein
MWLKKTFYVLVGACALFLFACGPRAVKPQSALDTPLHHVTNGYTFLNSGKIDSAFREFNRAKELDPKYVPAYIGLGLFCGYTEDYENGLENMKLAKKFAETDEAKTDVNVGYIRLYQIGKEKIDKDWLSLAEEAFEKATKAMSNRADVYYYMGLVYKTAYEFSKASAQFSKVLELGSGYVTEADREYAVLQKIERAMPGSETGKHIALVEKLTRADAAALLVQELKIQDLYKKRTQPQFDTSYKSPDDNTYVTSENVKAPAVTDADAHVLKADIDIIVELEVKGLQPYPDHTFKPDLPLNRAEYAMIMEDVLIKITGVDQLATRFIGSPSPFPDIRNDLPYFNAVMLCTTRGLMETKDLMSGVFDPMGPISGADALLAVRLLKLQF